MRARRTTDMPTTSKQECESAPAKKPYETPRLEVYGDIREIARAAGVRGMMDGFLLLMTQ